MATSCGNVLSNARRRYGNSKEGKSKAMRAYQACRKGTRGKSRRVKKVRRRRRSKVLGIF